MLSCRGVQEGGLHVECRGTPSPVGGRGKASVSLWACDRWELLPSEQGRVEHHRHLKRLGMGHNLPAPRKGGSGGPCGAVAHMAARVEVGHGDLLCFLLMLHPLSSWEGESDLSHVAGHWAPLPLL